MHLTLFFLILKTDNMTIYDYVAYRNPSGASEVIRHYGLPEVRNPKVMAKQLASCVAQRGDDALKRIAKVHPDFELIEEQIQSDMPLPKTEHSSACGCGGYSNADGQSIKSDVKSRITDKTELLITGGIILIGLAIVLKLTR